MGEDLRRALSDVLNEASNALGALLDDHGQNFEPSEHNALSNARRVIEEKLEDMQL